MPSYFIDPKNNGQKEETMIIYSVAISPLKTVYIPEVNIVIINPEAHDEI